MPNVIPVKTEIQKKIDLIVWIPDRVGNDKQEWLRLS